MFELSIQSLAYLSKVSIVPQWVWVMGMLGSVACGILVGWVYWMQLQVQSELIRLETRRIQSEFDLVSRDVIKIKQNVITQITSQGVKL
jgi:hypothetical protein